MYEIEFILKDTAKLPVRDSESVAINLFANIQQDTGYITIQPGLTSYIDTGVIAKIASSYIGLIINSNKYVDNGLLLNNPTTIITSANRDFIEIKLRNNGVNPYTIFHGEQIAQLLILQSFLPIIKQAQH